MKRQILLTITICIGFIIATYLLFQNSHRKVVPEKYTKEQLSQGRAQWRLEQKGGTIEPEKIISARSEMRNLYRRTQTKRDAGLNQWEFLGPPQVGGRVRAFAINALNGNILYTGGVAGGIFKSSDAGASWTALSDFLPSLSVTSILVNPNNPDIIYAATGEAITGGTGFSASAPGAGIFKSIDAGETWDLLASIDPGDLSKFYWVNDLAFDPQNPNIFYAVSQGLSQASPVGGCARLFRFTQGGDSLAELSIPCFTSVYSVYINPNDRGNIYLGSSGGLMVSQDTGSTWAENSMLSGFPSSPGRVEIGMSESDENIVYALCSGVGVAQGVLTKSTNKGSDWTSAATGLTIFDNSLGNAGNYHNTIWVDPEDTDNLILGGIDLWRSVDGGVSLSQISDWTQNDAGLSAHADQHIIVAAKNYDGTTNPRVYFGNDGGIARAKNWKTVATNSGWELLNDGLNITQFYASDIDGNNPHEILAGSQDNGTWYTDDGGATWIKAGGGDGGFCGLNKSAPDPRYISSQFGNFEATFPPLIGYYNYFDLSTVDNPPFIAEMQIYENDGNRILVGGDDLWQITHTGTASTVKQVSPRLANFGDYISAIEIAPDSSHIIVGYTSGDVFRSVNGSNGPWTAILGPAASNPKGFVTDIALNQFDKDQIMVTIAGYIDDNIWYSDDGGVTWEERSNGIPALHINTIVWHPDISDWLYVGTDMGVMGSEDKGQNWNVKASNGTNDGPALTEVTNLQFSQNNTVGEHWLVATTYGRGIWKTEFVVRKEVYIDEDCGSCGIGIESTPFQTIEEAVQRQAHGQRWNFDGGDYSISGKIIIDHNIGKIKTDNYEVIKIGN